MKSNKIYQVSTLQALALGYTRPVVKVQELLEHGDTGLGTFENVDGEMIILDGICYQAKQDGSIVESDSSAGVPFAAALWSHHVPQIRAFMHDNCELCFETPEALGAWLYQE